MAPGFRFTLDHGVLPPPGGPVKSRLAVRAVIRRGGLLLLVRSSVGGDWKFPGGGVEPRESPEEALAREVLEETGYETRGKFVLAGKVFERAEGRERPGSLFEMESRYYFVEVADGPGEVSLNDYEKDLGFQPFWTAALDALTANQTLLASRRSGLPPWLERETRVLEILTAPAPTDTSS